MIYRELSYLVPILRDIKYIESDDWDTSQTWFKSVETLGGYNILVVAEMVNRDRKIIDKYLKDIWITERDLWCKIYLGLFYLLDYRKLLK